MRNWKMLRRRLPLTGFLLLVLMQASTAQAALDGYMAVTGESQGEIQGDVTQPGREDTMQIVDFGHSISAGVVEGGFEPTGARQHRPIRVTKPLDKASMPLMQAMIDGEKLTNVTLRFYRPSNTGAEEHYLTIELTNAYIVNIAQTSKSLNMEPTPSLETVSMTYQKIIWTWVSEGRSAEDNWVNP